MLRPFGVLSIHVFGRANMYLFSISRFSWKSRQNRDPELRERKKELLAKRYTLRRIGALEDSAEDFRSHAVHLEQVKESISKILCDFHSGFRLLLTIDSIDKSAVGSIRIGSSTLSQISSISQPNSRTVVIVAKDRGSLDLIYKFVKRAHPCWETTLIDRERIQVNTVDKLPLELISKDLNFLRIATEKSLKKIELLKYKEIRSKDLCDAIRVEFDSAEKEIDKAIKKGLESI